MLYSKVPIIRTVLIFLGTLQLGISTVPSQNVDRTVYFYYCTAFPIIRTVLIFLSTFQIYVPYYPKK